MLRFSLPERKNIASNISAAAKEGLQPVSASSIYFVSINHKETFGLNSTKKAPQVAELKDFEDALAELTKNINFKDHRNNFQNKLKKDVKDVEKENRLIISADKTSNYYKIEKEAYDDLLQKSITKDYKKSTEESFKNTTKTDKEIATKLSLEDRIYKTQRKQAFITLKDHKPNFINKPTCRLLNPTKPELGIISKQKLANIVKVVREKTKLNSWKNTHSVLSWFKAIQNKNRLSFITYDVCEFYPSITEDLMNNSLDFANNFIEISDDDREIIFQARRSFLFDGNIPWNKKNNAEFDVGMGSFDGAECCDLVGLYMLSQLQHLNINLGKYRDDALGVTSMTPRQADIAKKEICKIYQQNSLSIEIQVNAKSVDFLDINLDLRTGIYKPFMKPNDCPTYIHKSSNHPPTIIKNIPESVNKRLCGISANEEVFNRGIPPYQAALEKSGYDYRMKYIPPPAATKNEAGVER